jgi:hypothetical protein
MLKVTGEYSGDDYASNMNVLWYSKIFSEKKRENRY